MAKRIAVTKENREFLMKAFKISRITLWKALAYQNDSALSKRIRTLAEKRGGVILVDVEMNNPSTLHDSDGWMRQYFGNGASVEFSKEDGHAEVWMRGEMVNRYENVKVAEIEAIQKTAMAL